MQEAYKENSKRPVTVADDISQTQLGNPRYSLGGPSHGLVAQFSPDGQRFVVILRKGNLTQNTNEYSMLLWNTTQAFPASAPQVILRLTSSSNRPAIQNVNWLNDDETVVFLGEHPGELQQLYSLNIRTRSLTMLTKHNTNLVSYSITPTGDRWVYVAEQPAEPIFDTNAAKNGIVFSTQWIGDIVANKRDTWAKPPAQLFLQSPSRSAQPIPVRGGIDPENSVPSISPDGRYIVIDTMVTDIPTEWKEYFDPHIREVAIHGVPEGDYSSLRRYMLVDTATDATRVLLDSPLDWDSEVTWAPDSHAVAVSGVYLPLSNTNREEFGARQKSSFAAVISVPGGSLVRLSENDLKLQRWDATTNRIIFERGRINLTPDPGPLVIFQKDGNDWKEVEDTTANDISPQIILSEGTNSPPHICAVDPISHEKRLLLDLNPQFEDLDLARVEEVRWQASDGRQLRGGLYYPINYITAKRYPLVIQTHGWNPFKFRMGGLWSTAFAAQALAGKGIVVLQLDEGIAKKNYDTPREAPEGAAAYESAIDYLDRKGLIDRSRVGIIGFSRSGLYVKYALTHSPALFAAAATVDVTDGGYVPYLLAVNSHSAFAREYEHINGGSPFGEGLKQWLSSSPEFNIDKVRAPLRVVSENPLVALLLDTYWYGASVRLGKPIEMIVMQDGEHVLQKPWERMISQQGNVDWFAFWLKDEEDPDPAKAEQYKRWHELRKWHEEAWKTNANR